MTQKSFKPNFKRTLTIAAIALLAAIMAFKLYSNKQVINENAAVVPQEVGSVPVKIAEARMKAMDNSLSMSGNIVARKEVSLTAEAQGSLIRLNIREGQRVRQGEVIARIDPTAIESSLATATAALNKAIKDKERYEKLAQAGAISQKQFEDMSLNVENARASLAGVRQQMKYTVIRSPMSGTVSSVLVESGSFATVGMKIGTVIDDSNLKMVIQVSETDVIKLKNGQPVEIKTEVYPHHAFGGTISLISVQADAGRKYDVEIELANTREYPLKAGMFGTATIKGQKTAEREQLLIPRKAIVGSVKDAHVFVLNADSTVTLQPIEVKNQSGDDIIVLRGLKPGSPIVVSGQINLQSGKKVNVIL